MSQSLKHTTIQTVVVSQITASLVLTAVYRLSNIPRQITFWEIIIIQFVCSSRIEMCYFTSSHLHIINRIDIMRIWRAVRGEGSGLGILGRTRCLSIQ